MTPFAISEDSGIENVQDGNYFAELSSSEERSIVDTDEIEADDYYMDEYVDREIHQTTLRSEKQPADVYQSRSNSVASSSQAPIKEKKGKSDPQAKWNHISVIKLLNIYKDNIPLFTTQCIKNATVWEKVRVEMVNSGLNYSRNQIMSKFKYLKSQYMCKKDNMGAKCTGQAPIEFEFYDEFDDMFSKKPNVIPHTVVSSDHPGLSRGIAMNEDQDEVSTDVMDEQQCKIPVQKKIPEKSAKNKMLTLLQDMQAQKNTRHEEMMAKMTELNERSCSAFEKTMQKFIDKM